MDSEHPQPDVIEGAPHPRMTPTLFGQARAEAAFLDAVATGRLHHAWLITGPRGIGKATLAWRIARYLLSEPTGGSGMFDDTPAPPATLNTDPESPVSRRVAALSEPRLLLCRRPWDEKAKRLKQNITVDEIRKLNGFFNLSATDGGRRVVIVDAADEMNTNAANALLKLLEEPPADAVLLLISHRPLRLLPTIRSRCRTLKCDTLGPEDMARALGAAGFETGAQTQALAALSEGSVGEAIRLLSHDGLSLFGALLDCLNAAPRMDRAKILSLADACVGKTAEARYDLTLRLIHILLHRLAVTGVNAPPATEAAKGEMQILTRLSPSPHAARRWAELAQDLSARSAHARAVNLDPASVILDMLLKIDQTAGTLQTA